MEERRMQVLVGVMVLATLLITGVLVMLFGEFPSMVQGTYTIYINFPEAPGVTKDTPIRKSGVLIGRVTDVELQPDRTVRVTAWIYKDRELYTDEVCVIAPELLGDATIEVIRASASPAEQGTGVPVRHQAQRMALDAEPAPERVAPGGEMPGTVRSSPANAMADLQRTLDRVAGSVMRASEAFRTASVKLGGAATSIDELLARDGQFDRAIRQAHATLENINALATHANDIVGDEQARANLKRAVNQLPATLERMHSAIGRADANLANLEKFTEPLGEGGPERVARLDQAIGRLDGIMVQMDTFSRALNDPRGSMGRLMRDPELYANLSLAARNIGELSEQLRPILDDARVFTDKIARHPEVLGVRGAMQRSPGIK